MIDVERIRRICEHLQKDNPQFSPTELSAMAVRVYLNEIDHLRVLNEKVGTPQSK